jgi:hypothetical protein
VKSPVVRAPSPASVALCFAASATGATPPRVARGWRRCDAPGRSTSDSPWPSGAEAPGPRRSATRGRRADRRSAGRAGGCRGRCRSSSVLLIGTEIPDRRALIVHQVVAPDRYSRAFWSVFEMPCEPGRFEDADTLRTVGDARLVRERRLIHCGASRGRGASPPCGATPLPRRPARGHAYPTRASPSPTSRGTTTAIQRTFRGISPP